MSFNRSAEKRIKSRDCRIGERAPTLKSAIEIPRMAEVTWCVHETANDAKTSFKDDHVVDLASRERDIRSVHIIKAAVTKKREKAFQTVEPRESANSVMFQNAMWQLVLPSIRLSTAKYIRK